MKFVSFNKYKEYLSGLGYKFIRRDIYYIFGFTTFWFGKEDSKVRYRVNVWTNTDKLMNIFYGTNMLDCKEYKIDMRKNFWKNMMI